MATRRGKNRFASQAALEALVRFGPELSGLKSLQRQAVSNLDLGVRQAHGTANAITGAINAATPQVGKIYDDAGLKQAGIAGTLIGHDLAGLGSVADSIKAGASLEAAGAADKLNLAKTNALTDLSTQKVRARQGEQFAIKGAKDQFIKDVTEILQRKVDLGREKGAFTAATIGDLAQAAAEREAKALEGRAGRRTQREIAQANRDNALLTAGVDAQGHVIPGGKADPKVTGKGKGQKVNTDLQHGELDDSVSTAQTIINTRLKGLGSRKELMDILVKGMPARKVGDTQVAAIPAQKPLVAQAALELAFDKKISRKTLKKLHERGYSIKKLGWKYASGKVVPQTPGQKLAGNAVDFTKAIAELLGHVGK